MLTVNCHMGAMHILAVASSSKSMYVVCLLSFMSLWRGRKGDWLLFYFLMLSISDALQKNVPMALFRLRMG